MVYLILRDEHDCDPADIPTEDIAGVARDEKERDEMLEGDLYSMEVDLDG